MQQERTVRVERFSNASSHGTSNMSTGSGTQTEGSVAEYWKQHGALRASYLEEVLLVYTTFEKFLAHDASDENGLEERRQVEYYMEFVQFCKVVLEEQTGLSAPRPWEDLARVRKYIQNIISPYVAKISPGQGVPTQPQPAPPPVQIAWHGRRHNDGGSRPTIFDVNTVSSLHPSSPSGSFTSVHSDDDIDYWRQHAILKESHFANCLAVQAAFQQYLARPLEASNPKQRNKLEYLLGYVNFCCQVLNESPSTHPVRPYADYKRVVKSINKIITPYMQKIHMENQTKALPSVNDLVQRAAPPNNPQVAAYWQQLAQLKQSYFSTVAEAHRFFQSYIEWFQGKRPQEQIQEIVYLVDYAEFCGQVMQEESHTHPPRTMEELNHVYNYITTIIIPHWDKLRAEAPRPAESVVSVTSSALQQTDSFLVEFDTDRLSVLSSSVHRSAVTDTSMSSVSSAEAKAYWRKLAALKELYADKVGTALSGFQKYAAEYSHAKSAAEARKLARLYEMLESVQFCATMFSETEQTHPPRDPADLDMIHQYIIQIVNPYCVRLETETKLLGGHHNNTIT